MNLPSKHIDSYKASIAAAVSRNDVASLIKLSEELTAWHESDNDDEKVQAAGYLDDIAAFLMEHKDFTQARIVIISSLRLKGTLSKESGMTTFSYQQLELCERASDLIPAFPPAALSRHWNSNSSWMLIAALLAVASVCGIFFLLAK